MDERDSVVWTIIIVFISIALYNVIELNLLIFSTFRKYSTLYFWSFVVCVWGVAFNGIGYLLRHLAVGPHWLQATIILVGWSSMINGQSLVLYSRLHLLLQNRTLLRVVLSMIVVNGIVLGIPIWVLVYGINSANPEPYVRPYAVFEQIQLVVFFVQELIISFLYIIETVKMLRVYRGTGVHGSRRLVAHLLTVNLLIILLDITILWLQFSDSYNIQTSWKALVYSIKLKAEFGVLNRLVEYSKQLRISGGLSPRHEAQSTDLVLERYISRSQNAPSNSPSVR